MLSFESSRTDSILLMIEQILFHIFCLSYSQAWLTCKSDQAQSTTFSRLNFTKGHTFGKKWSIVVHSFKKSCSNELENKTFGTTSSVRLINNKTFIL